MNEAPEALNRAIREAFGEPFELTWVSPLVTERHREYKDSAFLKQIGMSKYQKDLLAFWPRSGPRWDALATMRTHGHGRGILLLEAKSHVAELNSECKATSEVSRQCIADAFAATQSWLNIDQRHNWLKKGKDSYYQVSNRLAHLYFFQQVLGQEAWLVNLYFVDDPHSPTTLEAWESELPKVRHSLGIGSVPYAADIFLPAF